MINIFDELRDEIEYYKSEKLAIVLINLTSNKRKFSLDVENVGGNVSLALMKHDSIKFFNSDDKE